MRGGMEACASAHHWAREIAALGHDTKLLPPAYVKPFVKRQKNDVADAEAICEAAQRPTMRFVQGKSAEEQASAVVFRTRDLLVRQRTQLINALRGHLTKFGNIVRLGVGHVSKLIEVVGDPTSDIPNQARPVLPVDDPRRRPGDSYRAGGAGTRLPAPSVAGATSPPGSASYPDSTPAAARSASVGQRRWASVACAGF